MAYSQFKGFNTPSGADSYRNGLIVQNYNKGAHTGYQSSAPGDIIGDNKGVMSYPSLANTVSQRTAIPGFESMHGGYTATDGTEVAGNIPGDGSWLNADNLKAGAQGLQALSGLANAYMGYKNYGLAKDMFGFQKGCLLYTSPSPRD